MRGVECPGTEVCVLLVREGARLQTSEEGREMDAAVAGSHRETEAGAEERRHSKHEEIMEVRSLRRIISAYLNYADAAESDVRRYERSFKKLSTSHKALLSHLPLKFQELRRCISVNAYFIITMLQAFDPPVDMSQDIDFDDAETVESAPTDPYGGHTLDAEVRDFPESHHCSGSEGNCLSGTMSLVCAGCSNSSISCHNEFLVKQPISSDCHLEPQRTGASNIKIECAVAGRCFHSSISNGNINLPLHDWMHPSFQLHVPLVDIDKVRCIIRNVVRDWASEGQKERDECYKPILEELLRLFPVRSKDRPPCCLVPGAGLGRLALEISSLGFVSQGNEFSYYMMICSSFILNHTQAAEEWKIYPWIHSNCNSLSDDDQLRPVTFPDIHPASAGITEGFSMCGGDFVEVYNDPSQVDSWDAVVTCFFLDTAHNIVEYIEIISKILKPGGIWINFGPLLYHFADSYGSDDMSIELSLDDVRKISVRCGFEIEMEKTVETTYATNPRSMMQNRYYAAFWTLRKKFSSK